MEDRRASRSVSASLSGAAGRRRTGPRPSVRRWSSRRRSTRRGPVRWGAAERRPATAQRRFEFERRLQAIEHLLLIRRQHRADFRPHRVGHDPEARQELIEDRIGTRAILLEHLVNLPILVVGQAQLLAPSWRGPRTSGRWRTRSSFTYPHDGRSRDGPDHEDDNQQQNSLQLHAPQRFEMSVHCSLRSRPRRSPGVGLSGACTQRAT